MTKIDTNIAALKSLHHLQRNEEDYSKAVERLSSGKRINNAGDDAAGASIVNRMTAQISGMKMAMRNAADAISMAQVAEGAMDEVSDILQRMRELGVQAANGTYSGADRVALNQEINQLKNELIRISETTQFNTTKLLNGTFQDTQFEISFDESPQHTHTLTIKDMSPSALGMWEINSQLEKSVDLSSVGANKLRLLLRHRLIMISRQAISLLMKAGHRLFRVLFLVKAIRLVRTLAFQRHSLSPS